MSWVFLALYDCKIVIFGYWNTEGCFVPLCSATKLVDLPVDDFFSIDLNSLNTRGHSQLKPAGSLSVFCCCRYNFFSQHVIKVWNSLPANVVEATILHTCKSHLSWVDLSKYCILTGNISNIHAIIYLSVSSYLKKLSNQNNQINLKLILFHCIFV